MRPYPLHLHANLQTYPIPRLPCHSPEPIPSHHPYRLDKDLILAIGQIIRLDVLKACGDVFLEQSDICVGSLDLCGQDYESGFEEDDLRTADDCKGD